MRRLWFLNSILLLNASALVAADVVRLANGGTLEGQVIRDTPRDPLVVMNTGGKLLFLNRAEISSIQLDEDNRAEYARRAAEIKDTATDNKAQRARNAAAHFELLKWARTQHLFDYADQELMATLAAEPLHSEARKLLTEAKQAAVGKAAPAATSSAAKIFATSAGDSDDLGNAIIAPRYEIADKPGAAGSSAADILARARILQAGVRASDSQREAALKALGAEPIRAREIFLASLDPTQAPAAETRLAALTGIEALNPISTDVSQKLVYTTIEDPEKEVRKRAAEVIKSRHDDYALSGLTHTFLAAFADDGQVKNPLIADAAGAALKQINDKRVYQALLYYATMEIRAEQTDLTNFVTRQIDSFTVLQGAQVNVLVRLSFPIQFPEIAITSVKTTVKAPAAALSALSGMNFGNNVDAWAKWLRQQP